MSLIYVDPKSGGKLFQAGKDEIPNLVNAQNISILVLAAEEYQRRQLPPHGFPGIVKFFIPLDDAPQLKEEEINDVKNIARLAAMSIRHGNNVLSTCYQGRNRSGLVSGFILKYLTGCNGMHAIWQIKNNRDNALTNPYFRQLLILDDL